MKTNVALVGLALAGALGAPGSGWAQEAGTLSRTPVLQSTDPSQPPTGYVVVVDDDVEVLVEGIEGDLRKALDECAAGRPGPAAHELQKAAAVVRLAACRAPRVERAPLTAASDSVEDLAARLKSGRNVAPGTLSGVAGTTQLALAQHLLHLATRTWQQHDAAATGDGLLRALEHFAAAADWSRGGVPPTTAGKFEEWRRLGGVLQRQEAGWTRDQVDSALAGVQAELAKLRR